ncbi:MAG: carboxypeptidase regulatory-like domain-containing protein [Chitinophagales bacterium]
MSKNFKLSCLFSFVILSGNISAQTGTIAGIVIDGESSETLVGATVLITSLQGVGTSSDIDGRFKFSRLNAGTYTLQVSYISFETKTIEQVEVVNNELTNLDITLSPELKSLFGDSIVEIKVRPKQESINTLLTFQKNTIGPTEVMSRDIISRTPDKNSGEVLKRMSGTTIMDGKFVVIRGLSDRYNLALVNGNLLPSTEPDRKTFAFDLIPSAMLDNLIIYKSAQPNLPGDFAGGIILLNTRDIPDHNFISLTAGTGYNTVSTFKEYYSYTGGTKDWLGIDDGTRQLPNNFPATRADLLDLTTGEKAELSKSLAPWGSELHSSTPLDQSYQLSGGWVKAIGSKSEFGFIGALTYNNSYVTNYSEKKDYDNEITPIYDYDDTQYKNNILWGGLLNLAFKLNDNNKFSFKNSYSISATDMTTLRTGINYGKAVDVRNEYYYFASNQLFSTILSGDHFLSASKLRIKWGIGSNRLVRDEPDFRTVNYFKNIYPAFEGDTVYQMTPTTLPTPENLGIFYSFMTEKTYTANLDLSFPFLINDIKQSFSFGGYYLTKDRVFDAREMGIVASNEIYMNPNYFDIVVLPVGELLAPQNFADSLFYIDEITNPSDSYTANQINKAVYAMLDNKIGKNVRIVWGVRAEFFTQILHSFAYGASTTPEHVDVNTTETDSVGLPYDLLPSINITYSLSEKINIRFSGYKTIARPELRELAPFGFYDIETNSSVVGNPFLIATNIYNGDLKAEYFYGAGQVISGGVFYKKFYNPIGQRFYFGSIRELKPINDSIATVYGAEFELRKNLGFINHGIKFLEQFTFNTNLAIIRSNTLLHIADTALAGTSERQLQGQSDYVMNFGLTYINPKSGLSVTTLFNQIGRRISEYGNEAYDDIYENPRPLLDAQVSVPFLDSKGTVKLNISDLLNKNAIYYQDIDDDGKYNETLDKTIRSIDGGAKISISVNYKF